MPRPLRIEYENAFYHVMNRGRGRQRIYMTDEYYNAFLKLLKKSHQRFGLETPLAVTTIVWCHLRRRDTGHPDCGVRFYDYPDWLGSCFVALALCAGLVCD